VRALVGELLTVPEGEGGAGLSEEVTVKWGEVVGEGLSVERVEAVSAGVREAVDDRSGVKVGGALVWVMTTLRDTVGLGVWECEWEDEREGQDVELRVEEWEGDWEVH